MNRTVKPLLLPPSSQLSSFTKTSANVGVTLKDDENTVPTPNQMIGGSKKVVVKKKKKKVGGELEAAAANAAAEKKKIDARKKSLRRL